jgi:hypothetical protein
MDFRFEALVQGHGVPDVVDMDAMRLLEAFEGFYSGSGPSIGIDVRKRVLEVSFSVAGQSLEEATDRAHRMLSEVADASGLKSIDVISLTGEPELTEQVLAS